MSRARKLAVFALLSVAALLAASWFGEPSRRTLRPAARVLASHHRAPSQPDRAAPPSLVPSVAAASASLPAGGATTEMEDPLTVYLTQSIYPPTSRPLRAEQDDLIHPDRRTDALAQAQSDARYTYLLTADRLFVVGEDEVTVTLEVWRGAEPAAVRIGHAAAFVEGPRGEPLAPKAPVAFVEDGLGYVSRLSPGRLTLADKAVFVTVEVAFGDGSALTETARLRFQVTPPAAIPARFSGDFRDRIEGGSLVVEAGVEVTKPGRYAIDGNLWGADGRPVAWARFKGVLTAEDAWVPLTFFGKAVLDAAPALPLRLGELRGARLAEGEDPDLEAIAPYLAPYELSLASLAGLSEAPWDSPKKRAMIRRLSAAEADPGAPRLSAVSLR